jgi:hypothetical protein
VLYDNEKWDDGDAQRHPSPMLIVLFSVNGTYSALAIRANLSLNELRTHSSSSKGGSEAYEIANQSLASSRQELRGRMDSSE